MIRSDDERLNTATRLRVEPTVHPDGSLVVWIGVAVNELRSVCSRCTDRRPCFRHVAPRDLWGYTRCGSADAPNECDGGLCVLIGRHGEAAYCHAHMLETHPDLVPPATVEFSLERVTSM